MSDNMELSYPSLTMVLVGRTGNGKSATGNSILGRKVFTSKVQSSAVTTTCQLKSTVLKNGQTINVIDTPGLFDFKSGSEVMKRCLKLAKDGIHAILVVFSVRTRFSKEEEAAFRDLQKFFGSKIADYMIVVFTGGDDLEENDATLEDYLGGECPQPLKEIFTLCQNRCVLFNNKTKDETQKAKQLQQLLSLVDTVMLQNGGCPYTEDIVAEMEKKLKEATEKLERKIAEENAARLQAERNSQSMSFDVILKLAVEIAQAKAEVEALRRQLAAPRRTTCPIL